MKKALRGGIWLTFALVLFCLVRGAAQTSADALSVARAEIANGDLAKSEVSLIETIRLHPELADAHFLLGYVYFREQKAVESLAQFTVGAKSRRPTVEEFETIASDYVLLSDFPDADKWFSEVVAQRPDDAHAWYLLGRTKYKEGLHEQAVKSFERAIALHLRYVEAEDNLGLSLHALNKPELAQEAFQKAIDWQGDSPTNAQPYLNLATLLIERGDTDKAIPLLQKAVTLAPENPSIHEELGRAYSVRKDLPEAQRELLVAVKLAPDVSALHYKLGQIYQKQNMRDLAQQEFDICTKLNGARSSKPTPNPYLPLVSRKAEQH